MYPAVSPGPGDYLYPSRFFCSSPLFPSPPHARIFSSKHQNGDVDTLSMTFSLPSLTMSLHAPYPFRPLLLDFILVLNPSSTVQCPSVTIASYSFDSVINYLPDDDDGAYVEPLEDQRIIKVEASDRDGKSIALSYVAPLWPRSFHAQGSCFWLLHHSYMNVGVVGHGSFGVVCQGKIVPTEGGKVLAEGESDEVAIKKVLQDKRFKVIFLNLGSCPGILD